MKKYTVVFLVVSIIQSALALDAPQVAINASVSGDSIDVALTWSPVSGADSYRIYSLPEPGGVGELLAEVTGNQYSHTSSGSRFYYVVANAAHPVPSVPAPTPVHPEASVISLFSDVYVDVVVDTWSTAWDMADVEEVQIAGDAAKLYTNLEYAAVEFTSEMIDAAGMTHLHLDIWTPDPTAAPAVFSLTLVDYGTDCYWPGDDLDDQLSFDETSNPPLETGSWVSFDIPLSDFAEMYTRWHLAQLLIAGDPNTVYVDNVYLYAVTPPTEPLEPAPVPTADPANVISLFSNAYTNVPVDTWSADWDQADVTDTQIAGDDVKLYTNLNYAGIEFTSSTLDITAMTHFHIDIWTPDPTALPRIFWVKLVDFGANGVWDGGGDDVEDTVHITAEYDPPLVTGAWVSLHIPLSEFELLTTREHLAQLLIGGDPNTVFVDNVYFEGEGSGNETQPTVPAPQPTYPAGDVISLFSNEYADVPVDTWSAVWDQADVADFQVDGDDIKLYTNLVFAGIEFTNPTIDVTQMIHFRLDFWTPDPTALPAVFKIKLVDFGANGVYGGGDDVEYELDFTDSSNPPLQTGSWVTFDIPLSDFVGLTTREHLAQLLISGDPNTVFIDNVLFHR